MNNAQPSAGALRAANRLADYMADMGEDEVRLAADIIDRETGAAELLDSAKRVLAWCDPYALPGCDRNVADVEALLAAIAKAEDKA